MAMRFVWKGGGVGGGSVGAMRFALRKDSMYIFQDLYNYLILLPLLTPE